MPAPDKIHAAAAIDWGNRDLWLVLSIVVSGVVAKTLVDDDEIDWRKLAGEVILALIFAVMIWAFGVLQGMNALETIIIACLAGIGGVRSMQWLFKVAKAVKGVI